MKPKGWLWIFALLMILILSLAACSKAEKTPVSGDEANTAGDQIYLPEEPENSNSYFPSDGYYVQYQVNSASAGSISGQVLQKADQKGTSEVTAVPNLGYRFVRWSDGNTNPVRSGDQVSDNTTITAVFDYDFLEMPVLSIDTETGGDVTSKTEYIGATLTVLNTESSQMLDHFSMQIRGRGNNTWGYEKKSYKMKLSEKQSLLGLGEGKAKKWVLLANHCDQSLLRNYVSLHLAAAMPFLSWSPDCISVEVYLNGEYRGVYLLAEEVDVNPHKVAVSEEVTGSGADIGYLIEMTGNGKDITFDAGNKTYQIHNDLSENDAEWNEQYEYISGYVQACWDALSEGNEAVVGELIDIDSLVDAYLVEEIVKNLDVGWDSFYLYKDQGGKLIFGPLWDFDLALGNANEGCEQYESLYAAYRSKMQSNPWFYTAMNCQWFRERVLARWEEIEPQRSGLSDMVRENALTYYQSYCRNFEKWQIFGQSLNRETEQITSLSTYEAHYQFLASWIEQRLEWLDACYHEETFLTEWNGKTPVINPDGSEELNQPVGEYMGNQTAVDLFDGYRALTVAPDSIQSTLNGNMNEGVENLFDGDMNTKYCTEVGGWWWGHWGGWDNGNDAGETVEITFSLTESAVLSGYAFRTANDTSIYEGRNPESWVLYGLSSAGAWVQIDACDRNTMGMAETDYCYYGRLCDAGESYTEYKLAITHSGTLQLSEIALFGDALSAETN